MNGLYIGLIMMGYVVCLLICSVYALISCSLFFCLCHGAAVGCLAGAGSALTAAWKYLKKHDFNSEHITDKASDCKNAVVSFGGKAMDRLKQETDDIESDSYSKMVKEMKTEATLAPEISQAETEIATQTDEHSPEENLDELALEKFNSVRL